MERRTFIRLSAFTAAALSLPMIESCHSLSKEEAMSRPILLAQLAEEEEIMAVGLAYRKLVKAEDDKRKLSSELLNGKAANTNGSDLKSMLYQQVSADFASEKIVQLNGWILSVTEARQCALYSILKT